MCGSLNGNLTAVSGSHQVEDLEGTPEPGCAGRDHVLRFSRGQPPPGRAGGFLLL
jgi:hypothetical protein